ncbi:hypothetical protein SDRG_10605 [Saprolegnia diclina VS20]|uniref:Phospholipase B-like n=1 Tax=Saprolegnia diclina (strain VS20) TaxID=1156394 RepID=T0QAW7_SAPDV|nr:hypothetical protein SDRG_10605 [Saprolegnia diclina VS20]EQC31816.1 hypothetical protein SDRG_10605 [Saprolegnia diclina VS20]|eukprot:XP_008614823.1 hypothetical protein SDRG_10605 [Saprolegnia diclina VS20]
MVHVWCYLSAFAAATVVSGSVTCTRDSSMMNALNNWCMCRPCHLCEFSLRKGCQPLPLQATTTSNGSEIAPTQPILDSNAWFLTEDELTKSRGGVVRSSLTPSTSGNRVRVFPDTSAAFESMHTDVLSASSAYFTGWSVNDIPYIPQIDPSATFKTTWGKAIEANKLKAHGLVWSNLIDLAQVTDIFAWMNSHPLTNTSSVQLMTDNRIPGPSGSLHQKSLIVTRGTELAAYVGGLDQALDRWDTKHHNVSSLRASAKIQVDFNGWVDVHARVNGPASTDILGNFLDRWNDPDHPGSPLGKPFVSPPAPLQSSWNVPQKEIAADAVLSAVDVDTSVAQHVATC